MNRENKDLQENIRKSFDKLKRNIGKNVIVEYVWLGKAKKRKGILRNVENYLNIEINSLGIPFIGYDSAIRKIVDEKGNTLYENPLVPNDYNPKRYEDTDRLRAVCFGRKITEKFIKEREEVDKEWEKATKMSEKEVNKIISILKKN